MLECRYFKYSTVLIIPVLSLVSFGTLGWATFSTLIFAYALVPALEFCFKKDVRNPDKETEQKLLYSRGFDYMLYAIVFVQYTTLIVFLFSVKEVVVGSTEFIGRTASMGVCCGVLGINVAHELGHRKSALERFLAKALLLSSLYMHFIIEHNRGHHKNVSTPLDPASAKEGEPLQSFWVRSAVLSYMSAWRIEASRLRNKSGSIWSLQNEMIRFLFLQVSLLAIIYFLFGGTALIGFALAALLGILQLETVNYIEHYGLRRKLVSEGRYERVMPRHSWNSDHMVGRLLLFELSRHSDHHYLASRKYQVLRHHENSPQMPTGYPGMMLLSLVPPLWFKVMNPRLREIEKAS